MLKKLRKTLAEKLAALAGLKEKAFADDAKKEDADALDALMGEIRELKGKIKKLEEAEEEIAEAARSVNESVEDDEDEDDGTKKRGKKKAPAQVKLDTPAKKLGAVIMGMVKGYQDHNLKGKNGLIKGLEELGYSGLLDVVLDEKSLNTMIPAQGGVLLGETFNNDIIPLLYPRSSFMAGNPRRVAMPTGSYRQPAGASGATASYTSEGEDIAISQPTFKEINMTAHKLTGIVPITNELLQYSQGAAEEFVRSDLGNQMSVKADLAMYLGTGLGDSPTGIFNMPGITTFTAFNSTTPTQAQVDADARKLRAQFIRYPTLQNRLAWRMAATTWQYLADMTDGNGNYIYPTLQNDRPTWKGLPVEVAGVFPENLGGGTNETYLALVAFGEIMYGETRGLELAVSDQATLKAGNTVTSLWQSDQTAIRAITAHDVQARYLEAVALATGVKWGK